MNWLYLVLALVVVAFGVGVVVINRRRASSRSPVPRPIRATAVKPSGSIAQKPGDRAVLPPSTGPPTGSPTGVVDAIDESAGVDIATDDSTATDTTTGTGTGTHARDDVSPDGGVEIGERPRFRDRMAKSRAALVGVFSGVRSRAGITDDTWDDLEEALLRADVGVRVTTELIDGLRARVKAKEITEPDALLAALQADMIAKLDGADRSLRYEPGEADSPNVWLFVGVNGVGKTTTIGKVGAAQRQLGRTVLMAAGDTFRAAAAEQLGMWADRAGSEIVRGSEGGDPSSVIFDGIERASARGIDLVLADTAGRLHNKANLMEELRKVRRVAGKGKGRVTETLLVIDATTGQNGLAQAREFGETTPDGQRGVTGVVLTKLDGSAKGGIVFAIETELGLPVKLVGVGETIDDLVPFDPVEFIGALFGE